MENFFNGKKILFIAPAFFGYEREIKKRLEELGAHVDYHDDRPSTSAWSKFAIRVMPRTQQQAIHRYFSVLLDSNHGNYDFVFIIKMECMPADILQALREKNAKAKFIYYSYDSVKNNGNFRQSVGQFDSAFTFDDQDAQTIPGIRLRPLFFLNEYRDLPRTEIGYNVTFIGTAHSDRYALVKKISAALPPNGKPNFFFLFIPSIVIYRLKKLFVPAFFKSKISEFSFAPMNKAQVMAAIAKSNVILDFQHPNQIGLTMRTIEMVGARKKLITTNQNVRKYDFYRPENIAVIDREMPQIDPAFLTTPYVDLPAALYDKYSIDGWLRDVFSVVP